MKKLLSWLLPLLSIVLIACGKTTTQNNTTTSALSTQAAKNNSQTQQTTSANLSNQSLSSLKNTSNFLNSALEHIFEGQINSKGQAVGYHYEGLSSSHAKVIENTRSSSDKNGVYRAKITIDGKEKSAYSSFFPKTWTIQQVVDTINEAYENRQLESGNIYNGKTSSGITVQMYLTEQNKIISAFPLYNK